MSRIVPDLYSFGRKKLRFNSYVPSHVFHCPQSTRTKKLYARNGASFLQAVLIKQYLWKEIDLRDSKTVCKN